MPKNKKQKKKNYDKRPPTRWKKAGYEEYKIKSAKVLREKREEMDNSTLIGKQIEHFPIIRCFIPSKEVHDGIRVQVNLVWFCPMCGKTRGRAERVIRIDDNGKSLECSQWYNNCKHIDKYNDLRHEALKNGLNKHLKAVWIEELTEDDPIRTPLVEVGPI